VGTPCEEACEKVEGECGFPGVCDGFIDCGMQGADCYGQCILDADCGAIASLATDNPDPALSGCLFECQQGGQGGAGGSGQGGGGGGPPGGECLTCGQGSCQGEGFACFQDAACGDWLDCISGCTDAACVTACDQSNPGGPAADDVKACLCTSCTADCSALITCN
jgi:hypothetical protein